MVCPVCSGATEHLGTAPVLGTHEGEFRRCRSCGFLFAANPAWLDEAYATAITATDQGLVSRNIWFATVARSVVYYLFDANGRFLDYGGGTGLFTRLMRDAGYDWYWHDTRCRNEFATEFVADIDSGATFELVSAAELLEHVTDPVRTVFRLCALSDNILLTTELLPRTPPALDSWWYYGLEHGQHVSFYSEKALRILAGSHQLNLATNGRNLHLFSRKRIPDLLFRLVTQALPARVAALLDGRQSLLQSDYEQARRGKRSDNENRP